MTESCPTRLASAVSDRGNASDQSSMAASAYSASRAGWSDSSEKTVT